MSAAVAKVKSDVKVLKGQEAEDAVLTYIRRMNRPFGAVDVAANLKGAVTKPLTQKILAALAEKGEIIQKTYGKMNYYVADQSKLDTLPQERITELEQQLKSIDEELKTASGDLRAVNNELAKIKSTPKDEELDMQITTMESLTKKAEAHLKTLRAGTTLVSAEDLAKIDAEWNKWRSEWIRRKKIFNTFWSIISDSMTPQEAEIVQEDLGIERDTPEHEKLERSALCQQKLVPTKRKR
ncbi:Tat binding protein 1-interacting protein-domain-containing protein [Schizophyllum amplum]|uniref:Tat binding protein 1-interacting protein-domain-containing protein n=1 Tax=Schizophyllum amplum TaxID=97359 RepID=A0A550CWS9_9AGAR|nr:Tat binding protein 1-interacting protein-domain-containing protein [Auriculariopsis ampla]